MNILQLLAQETAAPQDQSFYPMIIFLSVVGLAFYFFILMPQKKEEKQRKELLSSLKKGDKIITAGGIHGVVIDGKNPDTVTVEIAKGTHVVFNRTSVSVIDAPKEELVKSDKSESKTAKK